MDKITFKNQGSRTSQAVIIHTNEMTKRALMKSLYNESQLTGIKITLQDIELDDSSEQFVKNMTFGIGAGIPWITNIQADIFWANMIAAGARFICLIIENTTTQTPTLSMGTIPGGTDIFQSLTINPQVDGKNGLTTVNINNVFDLHNALSIFLHHGSEGDAWNNANLNLLFLFGTP